ncbi:MAG: lytic transglycosylase domain-containing protein [Aeromicrobium sp.]|uniref:lytic transglycosylase domain-containing protein n=1 Tax=Aeromicrobium sp. TaxID=1871063 RepID=UPI003C463BA4
MAVLVAAWGAALSNTGLANASNNAAADGVPDVPGAAFDQPASVQKAPSGIDPRGGSDMAVSNLSANGIPAAALYAYRRAETLLSKADASCNLPWHLVAAIGRVESNHGRTNNNTLDADGTAKPGIYGVPLDGKGGRARITDTDNGRFDKDAVLDRAVGPMQFIPGTWSSVGVDADGDGSKNPQDIDDAATAAGVYLCAGPGDVSKRSDASAAVLRYNRSSSYVDLVLSISERYAAGDFTQSPNVYTTSPMLTSRSSDQSLTPAQRKKAAKKEKAATSPSEGGTNGGGTGTGGSPGTGTTPGGGDGGSGGGGGGTPGSGTVSGTVGGAVGGGVSGTPLGPVITPVTQGLSRTEATLRCTLQFPLGPQSSINACMKTFGY